jgi:3-oxoacyl-[acyl-carrier protein] reductase
VDLGLRGRAVLVLAASEGIGLATACRFAAEGAQVAICSRDPQKLARAAEAVERAGARSVLSRSLDVTDGSAVQDFADEVARYFGGLHVCVTNAGGPPPMPFRDTTPGEWQRAVELNLLSVVHAAHAVLPHMQQAGWGRLVTITSVAVRQPVRDLVYSNTVRSGVVGLVKSLSNEYGRDGITVNNVAPGYIHTGRLEQLAARRGAEQCLSGAAFLATLGEEAALGRVGAPEEVADTICWLASERAAYITGQTVLVDGGLYRGV